MKFDPIIKAFMKMVEPTLTIPYMENKKEIGNVTVAASLYRCTSTKRYYGQVLVIKNGEYIFEEGTSASRYFTEEEVTKTDRVRELISEVALRLIARRKILTFIANNPALPSILGAAFNDTLIIYTQVKGALVEVRMHNNRIRIDLPPKEQIFLVELMSEFGIKVERKGDVASAFKQLL